MKNIVIIKTWFILTVFISVGAKDFAEVVAYINNKSVEAAELKREMARYRSEVYGGYAKQFDLGNVSDFWNTQLGAIKPIDSLRNKALSALREIKIQENLLTRYKLWPYTNYAQFLNAWQEENIKREQAVKKGEIIYGPVTFSEQTFFDYRFSNQLIELKKKLVASGVIEVKEPALLNHFELLKSRGVYKPNMTFSEYKQQVTDAFIEVSYQKLIAQKVSQSQLRLVK